jgi:Flp pilus assembly protein TadD
MEEQQRFDDAMFEFSAGRYPEAITVLQEILARAPEHFDAQLALGMAYFRLGDYTAAIREGHKAEKLRPKEQLVHTNLSLFYMKAGDRQTAEHHGLQARIASWRDAKSPGHETSEPGLAMAPQPNPAPAAFPEMPWKKKAGNH